MRTFTRLFIGILIVLSLALSVWFITRYQTDQAQSTALAAFETRLLRYCISERMAEGKDTAICNEQWWLPDRTMITVCHRTTDTDETFALCLQGEAIHPPD